MEKGDPAKKNELANALWKALTQVWHGQNDLVDPPELIDQLTEIGLVSEGRVNASGEKVLRKKGLLDGPLDPGCTVFNRSKDD